MIDVTGVAEVEKKLQRLSGVMQAKLLRKVANKVASNSKKRITAQTDLAGKAWKSRSPNTAERLMRKKMLTGLRQRMRVLSVTDDRAVIGYTGKAEQIASEQQYGIKDNPHPARPPLGRGRTRSSKAFNSAEAATKRQAIALVKLGYKAKIGGAWKTPTTKWIMTHLMWQKAGVIIALLRKALDTESRDMYLPARSFLGVNALDNQELLKIIDDEINGIIQ